MLFGIRNKSIMESRKGKSGKDISGTIVTMWVFAVACILKGHVTSNLHIGWSMSVMLILVSLTVIGWSVMLSKGQEG